MASIAKRSVSRWRARYRDTKSKELARQFRRKINAQRSLDSVTTPTTTRTYVDPVGGRPDPGVGKTISQLANGAVESYPRILTIKEVISHGQHREAIPQRRQCVARPLPHSRRRPA
jgi:hypothetical protein